MKHKHKQSSWFFVASSLRGYVLKLHRDTRGAMSVLVILIIWCLVALVGMLYNNVEQARRRAEIQTAADSAAYSAATWMARTGNAINAQNMVICQDGSTESIWRAITPTDQALLNRLKAEVAAAQAMKNQQTLQDLMKRMQDELVQVGSDYQLTLDALAGMESGNGANYATPQEQLDFRNKYRQSRSVMGWVLNTYVNGAQPPQGAIGAPPRPGPPGPNGEGLAQIIVKWQPTAKQDAILDYIINYINTTEMSYVTAFEARTDYARNQPVDSQMAAHELEVFQNEQAMVNALSDAIEAQRAQFADLYKTDITLATLYNSPGTSGPARVLAPYIPASAVPSWQPQIDTIRAAYPLETLAAGLTPVVTIDPVNVHTDANRVWHPPVMADATAFKAQYPTLRNTYQVNGDSPGGWGHSYGMPLEHYLQDRVGGDMRDIENTYMVPLDQSRTQTLALAIRQMLGVPAGNINIANLPGTIPDDQPRPVIVIPPPPPLPGQLPAPPPPPPPPVFDNLFVLPRMTAPANASAAFRTQVDLYNQNGARFTADVRRLRTIIQNYAQAFDRFTQGFAADAWETNVFRSAAAVLKTLGDNKQFYVLASYGLRNVPGWAQAGLYQSTEAAVENQVMQIAMIGVMNAIIQDMAQSNGRNVGGGILDQSYLQTVLTGAYSADAAAVADQIVRPAARQIAQHVATEWLNRPWAYEMTPPDFPVPPSRGISADERKKLYTVIAAAREQSGLTSPKTLMPTFFLIDSTKLVAYAQGEMFNWMEFNDTYGGGEHFDQVVPLPELTYRIGNVRFNGITGAPRGWRVATVGGWQWRARLSQSDALYEMLQNNDDLRQYLQDAGVTDPPSGALNVLNLH